MTVQFRIDALTLDTTEGEVGYQFTSDLTVLAGPTGVGKTTLLELIKFGFGGDARLAPVAVEHVEAVSLDVTLGDEKLRLTRSLDQAKRKTARVTDLVTLERQPDHNVGNEQPSLNTLLLRCLGLPDDMRAAAGGNSVREGNRITFNDILTYLYIPQYEINRDIARSQDSYLEPKRRAVFELLFGLTDANILAMRSRINKLKAKIDSAEKEHSTVVEFLRASGTTARSEAVETGEQARANQEAAERELGALREEIEPIADRETQVVRDLLAEAERALADVRTANVDLNRRQAEYMAERRRVQGDLDRLDRMRTAGERLADIEFTVCPRCMQSLERHIPAGACRLCLQADTVVDTGQIDQYEVRQLASQLTEMEDQLRALDTQQAVLIRAIGDRERLIEHLSSTLETRTAERVTPRLQAFSDASQRLATARTQQELLEATLRQWDRVADLENAADTLRGEREQLKGQLKRATAQLEERRTRIVDEISEEFASTVAAVGIPGVQTASVDKDKYLPFLNGKIFSQVVQVGGGMATATQVAYWSSLLAIALRNHDTNYPAFLLLDSPRLALNTAEKLTAALYRRLVTQADANPGRVQFIIADNELPDSYRGHYAQVDFNYLHPTVATIEHPGESEVVTIDDLHDE
ncbi:AAA family ATPase [Umezawaea tangerina]|uniref:Nuclease SbcCD subunit C n=1 Tax=Umezawaea tangerina TaxID=84725 RepID=A0A2T0SK59_9PSEU|nr:AAA family ATPase [Umezawaea tangerina]PRY33792.1 AAA domain-containing protein [Umezawaea tangerina]